MCSDYFFGMYVCLCVPYSRPFASADVDVSDLSTTDRRLRAHRIWAAATQLQQYQQQRATTPLQPYALSARRWWWFGIGGGAMPMRVSAAAARARTGRRLRRWAAAAWTEPELMIELVRYNCLFV